MPIILRITEAPFYAGYRQQHVTGCILIRSDRHSVLPLLPYYNTHEYICNLYGTNTRVFRRSIPTSLMPPLSHFKYYKYLYTRKTKRHLRHSVCSMLNGNVLTLVLAQLQLAARHFWEYNAPNLCLSHGWAEFPIDTQQSSSMR